MQFWPIFSHLGPTVRHRSRAFAALILFAASILCGVIQIVVGLLRLGRYIRFVSRSVMTGFVNSLAILIFLAQMPELIGANWQTFALVAAALAIIYGLPRLTRAVPSPLVAIVVISAFVMATGLDVRTVGDMGQLPTALPMFHLPMVPLTWETLAIIAPVSSQIFGSSSMKRTRPVPNRRAGAARVFSWGCLAETGRKTLNKVPAPGVELTPMRPP